MFSYVSLEDRVPPDHPLRAIRQITDRALERLSPQFGTLYIHFGRTSVPPEKLLRALLLQALYAIRSERQLMEQLDYNLLFRWFVGLGIDDAVWSPITFSKNRDRLLTGDIAAVFFEAVLLHAETERLLSDDHFTVDGTLRKAASSQRPGTTGRDSCALRSSCRRTAPRRTRPWDDVRDERVRLAVGIHRADLPRSAWLIEPRWRAAKIEREERNAGSGQRGVERLGIAQVAR